MDFTREPIIETIITPKDGCKLVIRSSKSGGQEEFFVDAIEVVSFGSSFFYRSLERPKAFLVPASDYEVLEVREARMVLKNVATDRSAIKIGGGREAPMRQNQTKEAAAPQKEREREDVQQPARRQPVRAERAERVERVERAEKAEKAEKIERGEAVAPTPTNGKERPSEAFVPEAAETEDVLDNGEAALGEGGVRGEKKRDRRRHYRRRRGARDETPPPEGDEWLNAVPEEGDLVSGLPLESIDSLGANPLPRPPSQPISLAPMMSVLLPPPTKLISESIDRYKDKPYYRKNGPVETVEETPLAVEPIEPIAPSVSKEFVDKEFYRDMAERQVEHFSLEAPYEPQSRSAFFPKVEVDSDEDFELPR